jgi:hypothetical protein
LKYPLIFRFELDGDQDGNYIDQLQRGNLVGDESFGYRDACLDVLDVAYFNSVGRLRAQFEEGCPVNLMRDNDPKNDGLRVALPLDPQFPQMELRMEVATPGYAYGPENRGLNTELYNPPYFAFCDAATLNRLRDCFQPIYGNGCLNESSRLYNAPVAFWSSAYAAVEPDIDDGVAARSVYFGFEPFYFKPYQVRKMLDIILFEEWQLRRF